VKVPVPKSSAVNLAVGDLDEARGFAYRNSSLPFFANEGGLANARTIPADMLAGAWSDVLENAVQLKTAWERAGRPVVPTLATPAYALATTYAMCGDCTASDEWRHLAAAICADPDRFDGCDTGYAPTFDALALLHHGDAHAAVERLAAQPHTFRHSYNGLWSTWYAALWVEAAAEADHRDTPRRLAQATPIVAANPIAAAIVDRASALATGDRERLLDAAERLGSLGCRYQWARSLVFAGGEESLVGTSALTAMGAAPMAAASQLRT
jgi:hypothetical protein